MAEPKKRKDRVSSSSSTEGSNIETSSPADKKKIVFSEGDISRIEFCNENYENCKFWRDVTGITKIMKTTKFCKGRRKPY